MIFSPRVFCLSAQSRALKFKFCLPPSRVRNPIQVATNRGVKNLLSNRCEKFEFSLLSLASRLCLSRAREVPLKVFRQKFHADAIE